MKRDKGVYFGSLDGLRAFSILFVIFHHVAIKPAWLTYFHGWLGVDIFFVLSGFLITFLLVQEKQESGRIDLGAFYGRRAFRILPVYSVMLLVYIIATYYSGDVGLWNLMKRDLPYFFTFLNEFAPSPNGYVAFGFSWTLGVEEKFYLSWPVFYFMALGALKWKRGRWPVLAGLYVLLVACAQLKYQAARSYSGLLVGGILALLLTSGLAPAIRQRLHRIPAILPLAFFIAGLLLVHINRYFLFVFSWSVMVLVAHLVTTPSWLRSFLSTPLLTWVGKRSYSMYLIHMLVLQQVEKFVHLPAVCSALFVTLCTAAITVLLADVVFRLIEQPARDFGKKWLAGRKSAPGRVTPGQKLIAEASSTM